MKLCVIGKYPPIQGGTSTQTYWFCRLFADRGHHVHVVTNASEVEPGYRAWFLPGDEEQLQGSTRAGGELTLAASQDWDPRRFQYIPAGNPAVTRLAAMATEIVREKRCDLIFAWYLEPYGIAASLTAAWTGVPYVVRYAGSDRSCLMPHPEAGLAYKEVMRQAAGVLTMGEDLSGFGIPADRAVEAPGRYLPPDFAPWTSAADLDAIIRELRGMDCPYLRNTRPLDPALPVVGMYGKVGATKGTFDLLQAATLLHRRGSPVQVVIMGGGTMWPLMLTAIADAGLDEVVWTLPFLAPWRVPGFIRACTAVCFLEHDFAVVQHTPAVAAEVLVCGTALIVSAEVAAKQAFFPLLSNGNNLFLVENPADHAALADVIADVAADPVGTRAVGLRGAELVRSVEPGHAEGYEHAFGTCLARWHRPPRARPTAFRTETERLLRACCPATVELLGPNLTAEVETACSRCRDQGTAKLAAFLVTRDLAARASCTWPPSRLRQLAMLEHYLLWFGTDAEGIAGQAMFSVPVTAQASLESVNSGALYPVASRHLRVDRFAADVLAEMTGLNNHGLRLSTLPGGTWQTLLFHKRPDLSGAIYRIGAGTRELIARCDGATSLAEITARTAAGQSLVCLIERLRDAGIVAFARYPAATAARPFLISLGSAP
jgi:glycosyltransferase involved in cell wall biosynthesis